MVLFTYDINAELEGDHISTDAFIVRAENVPEDDSVEKWVTGFFPETWIKLDRAPPRRPVLLARTG